MSDFIGIQEAGAADVGRGRLTVSEWNSMRSSYSNILRAVDLQMRAKRMGLDPKNQRLLSSGRGGKL